jgi:hypothetical protein
MNNAPEVVVKDRLYENTNYAVHIVRVPDMHFDTYAVINKGTGVIEQIHPNRYNIEKIADQFDQWLVSGPSPQDDVAAFLEQFGDFTGGKSN